MLGPATHTDDNLAVIGILPLVVCIADHLHGGDNHRDQVVLPFVRQQTEGLEYQTG